MTWDEAIGDNVGIELHDSVVVSLEWEAASMVIRLSPAWVHRSIGLPGGADPGTTWTSDAILRLDEAQTDGPTPELSVEIIDGSVFIGGRVFDNMLPARLDESGKILVAFDFREGSSLRISASRVRLTLQGIPEFTGVWPPF